MKFYFSSARCGFRKSNAISFGMALMIGHQIKSGHCNHDYDLINGVRLGIGLGFWVCYLAVGTLSFPKVHELKFLRLERRK